MAIVSQLERGGTTLNLNDTSTGFSLEGDGWTPAVATPKYMQDPDPVLEVFNLRLTDSSQDNIATDMQALHQMQVWADQYMNDSTEDTPVWLHAKMTNETGERRALVHRIEVQYGASWYGEEATAIDIPLTMTVLRSPYWENTTVRDLPDYDYTTNNVVFVYDYTAAGASVAAHDIVGDAGARIRYFNAEPYSSVDMSRVWMGIRSANKHGSTGITNFERVWDLEDGTNNPNESGVTDTADGSAVSGNRVTLTETDLNWDDEWHEVLDISITNISASYPEDQLGKFLWLLRAKCSASSTTWEVQLRSGFSYMPDDEYIKYQIAEIDVNADWIVKEMGTFKHPIRNQKAILDDDTAADSDSGQSIQIWARRTTGSGDLHLDCLIPIPVDEGFCKLELVDDNLTGTGSLAFYFGQSPSGEWQGLAGVPATGARGFLKMETENFTLPPGDGRIYIVVADKDYFLHDDNHTIFNDGDVGKYYERWLSLRGSE